MPSRILVVDDSAGQRKQLRIALEGAGFEVDEAVDGVTGCAKVHGARFDAVVCDVNMPYIDGLKFVALIKLQAQNESLPVLMLTSENSPEMIRRGKEVGAAAWLVKPFQSEHLLITLRELLA